MIASFQPHFSILPEAQQRLWPALAPTSRLGLVLYGGTAIALRLGHRISVDFDFFTDKPLDKQALMAALPFISEATLLQDQANTLTVNVPSGLPRQYVKVSFFGSIGFGRYDQPGMTNDGVLQVAALNDLMATKVKILLQRVEAKDYSDIAAMAKAGIALDKGLAIAQAMYGNNFQPGESLKAMTYFEGGDLHVLTAEEKKILILAASRVRDIPVARRVSDTLAIEDKR